MPIHSNGGVSPTSSYIEPDADATLHTADTHQTAPAPAHGEDLGESAHNLAAARDQEGSLPGLIAALGGQPSTSLPQNAGAQAAQGGPQGGPGAQVAHGGPGALQPTLGAGAAGGQFALNKPLPPPPGVQTDVYGRYSAPSLVAPHISIDGSPEFHQEVDGALGKISQAPSGKKLVDDFQRPARKGNSLTIRETASNVIAARAHLNARQAARYSDLGPVDENTKATQLAQKRRLGLKGEGTNAEILWSPNKSLKLNAEGKPTGVVEDSSESHLALAHEMIHARRFVKGTSTAGDGERHDPSTPAGREELRAVGIGSRSNRNRISENSIRSQLGKPLRTAYNPVQEREQEQPPSPMRFNRPGSPGSSDSI